jgi:hypothetical protein
LTIVGSTSQRDQTFTEMEVRDVVAFLNHFVVTVTKGGLLKIWSKLGECEYQESLGDGYEYPILVADRKGELRALSKLIYVYSIRFSEKIRRKDIYGGCHERNAIKRVLFFKLKTRTAIV